MTSLSNPRLRGASVFALVAAVALASCAGNANHPANSTPNATSTATTPTTAPAVMPAIRASALTDSLAAHGVDVTTVGPLHSLTGDTRDRVMQSFSDSLGVRCTYCHVDGDFAANTVRKTIANQMWDRFVRPLRFADHRPLYCDSCHQRQSGVILDRHDDDALGEAMRTNYVAPLVEASGHAMMCSTCHGRPFVGRFLPRTATP